MLPDLADLDTYGGALQNYSPVVDPTRDEDARFRNVYASDVAMMTHTAARGLVSFVTVDNANPTDPGGGAFVHDAQWGSSGGYKPVISRTSEGLWLVTLPASVVYQPIFNESAAIGGGVTSSVRLRRAYAQCECSDGTLRHVAAQVASANTINVRAWDAAGTLSDIPGQTITVWYW